MAQGSALWQLRRGQCATTASEFANALGIGYVSRPKYMRIKLGLEPPAECNWMMQRGTEMEPWVAELYYRLMGACRCPVQLRTHDFATYAPDRRLGGSPDRIVHDAHGNKWLLECKTQYGDTLRTHVPPAHNLQMLGLCAIYALPYAHYMCLNEQQGVYCAEVRWSPNLWSEHVYPRLREFADMWTRRQVPGSMRTDDKVALYELLEAHTTVTEIPAVGSIAQARECQ